jgi:hypothetical protein
MRIFIQPKSNKNAVSGIIKKRQARGPIPPLPAITTPIPRIRNNPLRLPPFVPSPLHPAPTTVKILPTANLSIKIRRYVNGHVKDPKETKRSRQQESHRKATIIKVIIWLVRKYLRNREFREQLDNVRAQQGFPQVLPIMSDREDIKYFY